MKYTDLKNKDIKELQQIVKDLRVKLGKLRFELANKTLKNFNQLKQTKKDIARTLTAVCEGESRSKNHESRDGVVRAATGKSIP